MLSPFLGIEPGGGSPREQHTAVGKETEEGESTLDSLSLLNASSSIFLNTALGQKP